MLPEFLLQRGSYGPSSQGVSRRCRGALVLQCELVMQGKSAPMSGSKMQGGSLARTATRPLLPMRRMVLGSVSRVFLCLLPSLGPWSTTMSTYSTLLPSMTTLGASFAVAVVRSCLTRVLSSWMDLATLRPPVELMSSAPLRLGATLHGEERSPGARGG